MQARKACNAAGVSQPCDLASIEDRNKEGTVKAVISYVTTLMTEDKKSTGLKSLQVFLPHLVLPKSDPEAVWLHIANRLPKRTGGNIDKQASWCFARILLDFGTNSVRTLPL